MMNVIEEDQFKKDIEKGLCDCGVPRQEGITEIKGVEVRFYKCPKCGFLTYHPVDLQEAIESDRAKRGGERELMSVKDWILALLYAQKNFAMKGMLSFMKQLFLTEKEFAPDFEIPAGNFGYVPYKFGPYSKKVDSLINKFGREGIIDISGRKGTGKEYFKLTEKGERLAEEVVKKLTEEEFRELQNKRMGWDQLGYHGILNRVYSDYSAYTTKSEIREDILPSRWRI